MSYKYMPIPKRIPPETLYFFEVIKPLHWVDEPEREMHCTPPPVGAITWVQAYDDDHAPIFDYPTLHIEDNRYGINFDRKCFQLLEVSIQRIKK